jgi:hypothetical protein
MPQRETPIFPLRVSTRQADNRDILWRTPRSQKDLSVGQLNCGSNAETISTNYGKGIPGVATIPAIFKIS